MYSPPSWHWRKISEGLHSPAPQLEGHNWDLDTRFEEDPDMFVVLEDMFFYQAIYDGTKVSITADYPGLLPASHVLTEKNNLLAQELEKCQTQLTVARSLDQLQGQLKAAQGGEREAKKLLAVVERVLMKVVMEKNKLQYSNTRLGEELKDCKGGHLACAKLPWRAPENQRQCQKCERGGGFDMWNTTVDAILSSMRLECPHEGCGLYVTYHKLADHQSVCSLMPCKFPVPVCVYEGLPHALSHHISTVHPMPVHRIQYGKVLQMQVPLSEPRLLLFAEEDSRAFFLVGGMLDFGAPITVSVVCIRAGVSPLPHYAAKLWANGLPGEPNGRTDTIKVEMEVTSNKDPGDIAVQELTFFIVPPKLLGMVGLSRTVSLNIQIDKLTS
ncbi:putative E3 ubiquitin-protein ligase SINA-like 6 [Triticum dicoccoides]|uniref:putative E3 ubiquitin-protein ligase SINA-like 6 n=1 Tax=Triticum dicoccoides TaxID=85692 RepID=UPI0018908186|nr:putative E3 ubiquitin-protein ligase SINA-like 6 [Triticum dicoccoides]